MASSKGTLFALRKHPKEREWQTITRMHRGYTPDKLDVPIVSLIEAKDYNNMKQWIARVLEFDLPDSTIIYDMQSWATNLCTEDTLGSARKDAIEMKAKGKTRLP